MRLFFVEYVINLFVSFFSNPSLFIKHIGGPEEYSSVFFSYYVVEVGQTCIERFGSQYVADTCFQI